MTVSPAYGFSALALVKCSNEGGPGPGHNMKEDPGTSTSSLGRYVFGSEISYNKAPPRLPGLGC